MTEPINGGSNINTQMSHSTDSVSEGSVIFCGDGCVS